MEAHNWKRAKCTVEFVYFLRGEFFLGIFLCSLDFLFLFYQEKRKANAIFNRTFKIKTMYLAVTDVKPMKDYLLQLTFENGEVRKFDVKPFMDNGIFKDLKDIATFNSVRLSFDTIQWSNEADLDPEILYQNSEPVT